MKLFLLLTSVASLCVLTVGFLVRGEFAKDKLAYVFDSVQSQTKTNAFALSAEVRRVMQVSFPILEIAISKDKKLSEFAKTFATLGVEKFTLLRRQNEKLETFDSFDSVGSFASSSEGKAPASEVLEVPEVYEAMAKDATANGLSVRMDFAKQDQFLVAWPLAKENDLELFALAQVTSKNVSAPFGTISSVQSFVLNKNSEVLIFPSKLNDTEKSQFVNMLKGAELKFDQDEFVHEVQAKENWLVAGVRIEGSPFFFVSAIPYSAIEAAFDRTLKKIWLFVGFILFLLLPLAMLASKTMTGRLQELFKASEKLSRGEFDVNLHTGPGDELQALASAFSHMSLQIKNLLVATVHKARMDKELALAHTVQSTLFPHPVYQDENIALVGHYESASECGGDWWNYSHGDGSYLFCIGDATGHGVSAALVTSAAKSAFTVVKDVKSFSLSQKMNEMNRAIFENAKGQVMMTFFMAEFNPTAMILTYVCASHEPLIVIRKKAGGRVDKKDILHLNETNGPRLGASIESRFETANIKLEPGDLLVFYTDGVFDIANAEGRQWSERQFTNVLLSHFNADRDLTSFNNSLEAEIKSFRQGLPLKDDLTYFIVQIAQATAAESQERAA